MNILITGAAGFIGFHVSKNLLKNKNYRVIGLDNLNDYYDPKLKRDRLKVLKTNSKNNFIFYRKDLNNIQELQKIFKKHKFKYVLHLAAQAGVRYSLKNPDSYFNSNILGFYNMLKCSTKYKVKHVIIASSSSVYGENSNLTKETSNTDNPLQFYAATKKTNEVIAHTFANIYKTPISAIRFFTVYGPWGRPDMSLYNFTKNIIKNKKINLYNKGRHYRDFTYIDDIVNGVVSTIKKIPNKKKIPYEVYNLGRGKPVDLRKFLKELEKQLKKKAKVVFLTKQKGDVYKTHASIHKAKKNLKFNPKTNYKEGISKFLEWFHSYYQK